MLKEIILLANGYPAISKSLDLALYLAQSSRAILTALYVIDSRWDDILGDEWISDEKARRDFCLYFEEGLKKQAGAACKDIVNKGKNCHVRVHAQIEKGRPEKIIISACSPLEEIGMLVLPLPPRNTPGALHINPGKLVQKTACPVLTVPEIKKVPEQ